MPDEIIIIIIIEKLPVIWPMNGSKAGGDLVSTQTFLVSHVNAN